MALQSKAQRGPKPYQELLARFQAAHPSAGGPPSEDAGEIAEFIARAAPKEARGKWLGELMAEAEAIKPRGSTGFGTLALMIAGAIVAATLFYGIFLQPEFLVSLADVNRARGLITFLFAFGTIAVILIISIATFWSSIDEVERRAALAKDTLTILIGILGTILGFYFGALEREVAPVPPAGQVQGGE